MFAFRQLKNFSFILLFVSLLTACAAVTGQETVGEYIDDATITTKVKASIFNDSSLKSYQIKVETFQGEVQLSGFVDSSQASAKAEQYAKKTKGVKSVKNNLVVRSKKTS